MSEREREPTDPLEHAREGDLPSGGLSAEEGRKEGRKREPERDLLSIGVTTNRKPNFPGGAQLARARVIFPSPSGPEEEEYDEEESEREEEMVTRLSPQDRAAGQRGRGPIRGASSLGSRRRRRKRERERAREREMEEG